MKEKLKLIAANKIYSAIILFVLAFVFRIVIINTYQVNKIGPDGTGYHTLGVNFAKGNDLSMKEEKPYEKFFFREPVYPIFLGLCYKVYGFFGGTYNYIAAYDIATMTYDSAAHQEIVFAKYAQALFDSLSVVVFYLILLLVFKSSFAFVAALLFCFYYPVAIHSTYIHRETIQLFIILCMSYLFALFLYTKKWLWLFLFSCFWGISNLILQVTVVLPIFIFIYFIFYFKRFFKAILLTLSSTIIMFLFISPWLIKIYNYYPDIRILKTFGCSFTYEMISYTNAIRNLAQDNKISAEEAESLLGIEWNSSSFYQFKRSFDGTYKKFADSVNQMHLKKRASVRIIRTIVIHFYKSWFSTKLSFMGTREFIKKNLVINSLLFSIPLIIGLFGFIGIIKYLRRCLPILLMFFTFISLFYFLGSEYRRMLTIQPFIFMFGCLGFDYLYGRIFKRTNNYSNVFK